MKTFAERLAEDRRLAILRLLERSSRYEANQSLIAAALRDFGHAVSHDQVRDDLAWLEQQGLATVEEIATISIARLTQRGLETAAGIVVTPGVKRPGPGRPPR